MREGRRQLFHRDNIRLRCGVVGRNERSQKSDEDDRRENPQRESRRTPLGQVRERSCER
jgi:hypothetical protein